MSRTARERLIAGLQSGEFVGLSKLEIARRIGVGERTARKIRASLVAHETKPTVQVCAGESTTKWRNVEEFDISIDDDAPPTPITQAAELETAHSIAPDGYHVKGVSTLYDADGVVRARWVKTNKEQEDRHAAMVEAITHIADAWPTIAEPVAAPASSSADLMAVYMMGDPHLGLYSWAAETGEDFDLGIAERTLVGAADRLVALAPPAAEALVVNVGDFFHSDNSSNRTTRSGHALDVDTRWAKVMQAGVRTMRRIIDRALEKHDRVRVVNSIGNHDDHSSIMLSIALAQFYEREPRVSIDTSPAKFHWHRFGSTLIGVTHGDTVKSGDLPGVMACDRAKDWGETIYRYWICGHIHHDTVKEYAGVVVETLRTMAARDNWSHAAGYRSGRDMKCDVYHRQWGRVIRHTVGVHQLEAA